MANRLGELLVQNNLISAQQLAKAQDEQKRGGGRLGYNLTKLGYIKESELTSFISKQYGVRRRPPPRRPRRPDGDRARGPRAVAWSRS